MNDGKILTIFPYFHFYNQDTVREFKNKLKNSLPFFGMYTEKKYFNRIIDVLAVLEKSDRFKNFAFYRLLRIANKREPEINDENLKLVYAFHDTLLNSQNLEKLLDITSVAVNKRKIYRNTPISAPNKKIPKVIL